MRVSEDLINRQEYNFPPDDIFSLFCPGVKQTLPNRVLLEVILKLNYLAKHMHFFFFLPLG